MTRTEITSSWRRVSRTSPCPVCESDKWCAWAPRGDAVRCMRVASPHPCPSGEGHLHYVDGAAPPPRHRPSDRLPPPRDWAEVQRGLVDGCDELHRRDLASLLCVDVLAVETFGTGWCDDVRALGVRVDDGADPGGWTWLMRSSTGGVTGLRVRLRATGDKRAAFGSRLGVVTTRAPSDDVLYVTEGESDALALLTLLPNASVLATPGAGLCASVVAEYARGRDVLVLRDNDDPGRRGAERVARACQSTARSVRIAGAPGPHKDLRDALRAGQLDAERFAVLAEQAEPFTARDGDPHGDTDAEARQPVDAIEGAWKPLPVGMLSTVPPPRQYVLRWSKRNGIELPAREGPGFASGGIVGVLSGAGGTAKSMLLLMLGVSIVTGRRWFGFDVGNEFVGRRCMLMLAEEELSEVHRRLYRLAKVLGLDATERALIEQKLFVLPLRGKRCGLTIPDDGGGLPTVSSYLATLRRLLQEGGEPWGMVALDPQSRVLPGCEGSNDAATYGIQLLEQVAEAPGTPLVLLAGHSSKAARREGKTDARGVTGLTDAARLHLTLTRRDGGRLDLGLGKTNYGADADRPIALRMTEDGVPMLDGAPDASGEAEPDVDAQLDAMVQQVVHVVEKMGGTARSKTAITKRMKGRRDERFEAVDEAAERGAILDRGEKVKPRYALPDPESSPGLSPLVPPGSTGTAPPSADARVAGPVPIDPGDRSGTGGDRSRETSG